MSVSSRETRQPIPAAFFRDDEPPLPPPGDPHRREWYRHDRRHESAQIWVFYLVPIVLLLCGALALFALFSLMPAR